MAKKPDVWMPFYVGDYLRDTARLTTIQHGAYLLLILDAWVNAGSLPANDRQLRSITKMDPKEWRESRDILLAYFTLEGEEYRHKRIDIELSKAGINIQQRSKAGKASAAAKAQKRAEKMAENDAKNANEISTGVEKNDDENPTKPSTQPQQNVKPSPSPSPSDRKRKKEPSLRSGSREVAAPPPTQQPPLELTPPDAKPHPAGEFEEFWKAYPGRLMGDGKLKKANKKGCFPLFVAARKKASMEVLLTALADYQRGEKPNFIVDPERWLKRERWLDETADLPAGMMVAAEAGAKPTSGWAEQARQKRELFGES